MQKDDMKNTLEFQANHPRKIKIETINYQAAKNTEQEKSLHLEENIWEKIFQSVSDWIFLTDIKGRIIKTNKAGEKHTGLSCDEIIGQSCCKLLHNSLKHVPNCPMQEASRSGQQTCSEILLPAGKWIKETVDPVENNDKKNESFIHIVREISQQKKTEQTLRISEQKYENIFRQANDSITYLDSFGKIIDVNDKVIEVFGGSRKELINKHFTKLGFFSTKDIPKYIRLFKSILTGENLTTTVQIKNKKGQKKYLECSASLIKSSENPARIMVISRDITDRKKMEGEIRRAEQERKTILNSMSELVIYQDIDHKILWANKAACELIGLSAEQIKEKFCYGLWHDSDKLCDSCPVERTIKTGQSQQGEITSPDGNVWNVRGNPVCDSSGKITGIVEIVNNITERKKAERALQKSEEKYRSTIENMIDIIYTLDMDGNIASANKAVKNILGFDPDELIGRNFAELIPEDELPKAKENFELIKSGEKITKETILIDKKGKLHNVEFSSTPIMEAGQAAGSRGIVRDITERKKAEWALLQSEERYREIFNNSAVALWEMDFSQIREYVYGLMDKGHVNVCEYIRTNPGFIQELISRIKLLDVNNTTLKIFKADSRNDLFEKFNKLLTPDAIESFLRCIEKYISGDITYISEQTHNTVTGEVINVRLTSTIMPGSKKTWKKILITLVDITERMKAEQELKKEHNLLRLLIDNIPDRIFLKDKEHRFILVNNALVQHKGFKSEDELIGKTDFDLYPEEDAKVFCSQEKEIINKGKSIINERCFYKDENGNEEWSLLTKVPLRDLNDDIIGLAGIKRNITEQKKAEDALRESEEKLGLILDTVPAMIWLKDVNGKYVWINKCHADSIGVQKNKTAGKTDFDIFPKEQAEKFHKNDMEVLKTLKPKLGMVEQYNRSDGTIGWVRTNKIPFFNNNNELVGTIGLAADITEQIMAQDALSAEEQLLNEVGKIAKIGGWERDLITKKGKWTKAKYDIFEIDHNKPVPTREEYINYFLPEYRPRIYQAMKRLVENDIPMDVEAKLQTANGNIIWCRSIGRSIRKDGVCIKVFGTLQDISDNKRTEEILDNHRRLLEKQMYLSKTLLDAIPYVAMLIKPKTREIVASNKAAIKAGAIPGKTCYETWAKRKDSCPWCKAPKLWKTGKKQHIEVEHKGIIWDVYWVPVSNDLYMHFAFDITERKKIERNILEYQKQLKSLASQLTLTEEKERHRIATNLHDHIGQYLAVSRIKLVELLNSDISQEKHKTLKLIEEWLYHAIKETRSLTYDLSSPILHELGIEKAIAAWLDDEIRKKYQIETEFYCDKLPISLEEDIQVLLFRDVRELLFNAVKHAHAGKIKVSIITKNDKIQIIVEDDGIGFNPDTIAETIHGKEKFGLFSIRERLEHFGGNIIIETAPDKGCKVTLTAPLKKD